jgi:hypothetical protein
MKNLVRLGFILMLVCLAFPANAQTEHPFPPAPVYSELLSTIKLRSGGEFKPNSMYAYFMPADKGLLKVLRNGAEIAEFSWRCAPYTAPMYEIDGHELIKGKNSTLGLTLSEGGDYELAYYTGGAKFYSFPFELVVKGGADPYNPKKQLLLNGPWNDHAYLYKTSNESHGRWEFKVWTRSDDGSLQQSKGRVRLIRDQDKKIVAVGSSNFRREGAWRVQTFDLKIPGKQNDDGDYYDNKDLPANSHKFQDGGYSLNFLMDGKLYGTYKFNVKAGEIQLQGRQVRSTADPLKFIEGGGKEIWLKKS